MSVQQLPVIGSTVSVQWSDGFGVTGEVTDHFEDETGFEIDHMSADLADVVWRELRFR